MPKKKTKRSALAQYRDTFTATTLSRRVPSFDQPCILVACFLWPQATFGNCLDWCTRSGAVIEYVNCRDMFRLLVSSQVETLMISKLQHLGYA